MKKEKLKSNALKPKFQNSHKLIRHLAQINSFQMNQSTFNLKSAIKKNTYDLTNVMLIRKLI